MSSTWGNLGRRSESCGFWDYFLSQQIRPLYVGYHKQNYNNHYFMSCHWILVIAEKASCVLLQMWRKILFKKIRIIYLNNFVCNQIFSFISQYFSTCCRLYIMDLKILCSLYCGLYVQSHLSSFMWAYVLFYYIWKQVLFFSISCLFHNFAVLFFSLCGWMFFWESLYSSWGRRKEKKEKPFPGNARVQPGLRGLAIQIDLFIL